jgi:hypothetical protein
MTRTCPPFAVVVSEVRAAVLTRYRPDSCIASARALLNVLAYYGITGARAVPVAAGAWNAAAWQAQTGNLPPGQWPRDAYAVRVDGQGGHPPGGWDGHLVVTTGRYLLDPSIDQASRPEHGLHLAPAAHELPRPWDGTAQWLTVLTGGTVLVYEPITDTGYKRSPNWSARTAVMRQVTGTAIRALNEQETTDG